MKTAPYIFRGMKVLIYNLKGGNARKNSVQDVVFYVYGR